MEKVIPVTNDTLAVIAVPMTAEANESVDSTKSEVLFEQGDQNTGKQSHRVKLIMTALCLTVFIGSLDIFVMTTAIPTIVLDLSISDAIYAWIGSAYMLAFVLMVPIWVNFSDIFGRKIVLLITNVLFFIGSLVGALSSNAVVLITGRVIQGIGGGGLVVLTNICVGDLFSVR